MKNEMKYDRPKIKISGDDAIVVEFGDGIHPEINAEVQKLMRILEETDADYIVEMVPTYRSLLVQYNPLLITFREISEAVLEKIFEKNAGKKAKKNINNGIKNAWFIPGNRETSFQRETESQFERLQYGGVNVQAGEYGGGDYVRLIEVPTLYGGEHGADLSVVAETNGLREVDVVRIHSGRDYLVYMLGFMPGFPYLGGLDERIHTPRLSSPRTKIPAGSVGIAEGQTGIYPSASPGGWRLIGRTPLRLYDPDAEHPVFISAGDYIRYIPIGIAEFSRLEKKRGLGPKIRLVHRSELRDCIEVEINPDNLGDFGSEYRDVRGGVCDQSDAYALRVSDDGHIVPQNSDEKCVRVRVVSPGALTTVQDLGRVGYQKYGIPVSGAMDQFSCRIANILVGNREEEAVLEATYMGPELLFEDHTAIAVTGGSLQPKINGVEIPMYRRISVKKGDVLSFGTPLNGIRAYIAIAGSMSVPFVNGSKSTYLKSQIGGPEGRKLQRDDVLDFVCRSGDMCGCNANNSENDTRRGDEVRRSEVAETDAGADAVCFGAVNSNAATSDDVCSYAGVDTLPAEGICEIRVVLGPQDDCFTEEGIRTLCSEEGYEITAESDRMGMKLSGVPIEHLKSADIVSDAAVIGAVQVPADGQPIILLADRQTTGGYTKIGVVIKEDVYRLAQMAPGTRIRFKVIGIEEAQERYRTLYDRLDSLKREIKRRNHTKW